MLFYSEVILLEAAAGCRRFPNNTKPVGTTLIETLLFCDVIRLVVH
jgi:hypothetical protein